MERREEGKKKIKKIVYHTINGVMVATILMSAAQIYWASNGLLLLPSDVGILKGNRTYCPVNDLDDIEQIQGDLKLDTSFSDESFVHVVRAERDGIEMQVQEGIYKGHEEDFEWCKDVLNDIFSVINPDISFYITIENMPHMDSSRITYRSNYEDKDDNNLAKTFYNYTFKKYNENKMPVITDSEIYFNFARDSVRYKNYIFRSVMLHETLHALGLSHVEKENGGQLMPQILDTESLDPIVLSPVEMSMLISYYGDKGRSEEYIEFLEWYQGEFDRINQECSELKPEDFYEHWVTQDGLKDKRIICSDFFNASERD